MRPFMIASAVALAIAPWRLQGSDNPGATARPRRAPSRRLAGFVNGFIEASFKANPGFAVAQGRHEYDGQIADLSQAGDRRRGRPAEEGDRRRAGIWRRQADRPSSATSATIWSRSPRGNCSGSTRPARTSCTHNPASYLGFVDPSVYVTVPYAPKEQRLKSYIKFLQNIPRADRADARQYPDANGDQLRRLWQERRSAASSIIIRATARRRGRASARPKTRQALKAATDNAVEGDEGHGGLGRKPARRGQAQLRARQGEVPADAGRHRNGDDAGRAARADRPRGPGGQPEAARRSLLALRGRAEDRGLHGSR